MDFTAVLTEKKQISGDIIYYKFKVPEEFTFDAGQFVMIKVEKDGVAKNRAYSILNSPDKKGLMEICIKIVENGFASTILKDVSVGTTFSCKGPLGHFTFDAENSNQEHWFLGGGIGITPLYSMLAYALPRFKEKDFVLIYSSKTKEDLILHDEFLQLAVTHENFHYVPTLTRESWDGKMGRIPQHLGEDFTNKVYYICGLKEFIADLKSLLLSKDVPLEDIKIERYN